MDQYWSSIEGLEIFLAYGVDADWAPIVANNDLTTFGMVLLITLVDWMM
jgi:hypothetical protein